VHTKRYAIKLHRKLKKINKILIVMLLFKTVIYDVYRDPFFDQFVRIMVQIRAGLVSWIGPTALTLLDSVTRSV
jgi:hypothetical protein